MSNITSLTLEVADLPVAGQFYDALGIASRVGLRTSDVPTSGVRSFEVAKSFGGKYVEFATATAR